MSWWRRLSTCHRTMPAGASWLVVAASIALLLKPAAAAVRQPESRPQGDPIRVRIAWGGGAARLWSGSIRVSEGTIAEPRPLGIEADEPGSMWIDSDPKSGNAELIVRQRSPRSYDGVDVQICGPTTAKLLVRLSADAGPNRAATIAIPLAELSNEFAKRDLDDRGNRVLAMRAPGDLLRVRLPRDHLVFTPGERLKFDVRPHGLPLAEGGQARLKTQLLASDGNELWSHQQDLPADPAATAHVEITLPAEEGVYDVVVTAATSPNWSQTVRKPLSWKRTLAQRRVQLLVLRSERPPAPSSERNPTTLVEIDPANPRWYEKLGKLPQWQLSRAKLPRWLNRDGRNALGGKGELNNDCLRSRHHSLGELVELKPNADSPDVSWAAYWLPVNQPGRPHVLEVDYPSDVPQTLGLSVLEPDAAGAMSPLAIDAGVDNTPGVIGSGTPRWQHHRMIFWPRTNTPLLLVTNGRERQPAVYGKIRVLVDGERLPRLLPERTPAGRLLLAYMDRPLLADGFSAHRAMDPWSSRCLDDWETFYEAGTRLVDYLHHAGHNGLMLAVLADGSTIYPSSLVEPTPRYDTGGLMASGQDPVRKDVVEMLLRLFDREQLQLIPMVEFGAPLPELEALRRRGGPDAVGIDCIGADGTSRADAWPARRGLAPYYNVLDPRVQQAMLGVLREVSSRYAGHPAFAGLAVRLSADGYAQLPSPDWTLDDATISRFEHDTGLRVPGEGTQRFAQRATFLADPAHRQLWLQWRCCQVTDFYRRVAEEVASLRANGRLYLAAAEMIGSPELEAALRPALPRRATLAATLAQVGIDPQRLNEQPGLMFLQANRVAPEADLASRAAELEIAQMPDADHGFHTPGGAGSLFFRSPRQIHIESFDQKSPFRPGAAWLVSQPSPSDWQNRQRFVRSLASLDSQVIVDGGWALPAGQEDSVRRLIAAYRALPAVRFETVAGASSAGSQPATFRAAIRGGQTYLYAVNDSPIPVTGRLRIEAGSQCRVEELTGLRKIAPLRNDDESGLRWEVALEPYDLVAVRLSEPATCSHPEANWPESVEAELGSAIRRLGARAAALRTP
ncbi:MAG: hypothetical protein ABFC96_17395, partial [Thermoguttaceae bacterium]